MMTQDESQIEAQQMSQDEDEEDDDDHESESSRESHFEGANDENDDGIEVEGEEICTCILDFFRQITK